MKAATPSSDTVQDFKIRAGSGIFRTKFSPDTQTTLPTNYTFTKSEFLREPLICPVVPILGYPLRLHESGLVVK